MIKNKIIIEKIEEKTKDDNVMKDFLLDIVNHENESSQFKNRYKDLIDRAVKENTNALF